MQAGAGDGSGTLRPAATVIVARPATGGFEVLMLRRDSRLAFAAGMWVFPGGRIDEADLSAAGGELESAEALAAVREAAEEAGLELAAGGLVRWSHWTPPDHGQSHRFSTAFFVAVHPGGEVVIDQGEITAHRWVAPAQALERHAAGAVELAPPTYITLHQLAEVSDVDALVRGPSGGVEHFTTRIAFDGDVPVALYHGDAGYDTGDAAATGRRHRLVMSAGGWSYVRD